jgi:hypothetical protein
VVKFPAFRSDPLAKFIDTQHRLRRHPLSRQSLGPFSSVKCFSGAIGNGEPERLAVAGHDVFTFRDIMAQLGQQELPR